ncbi:hypothetical protein HanPI659440_Chr14g0544641 [Helianthus annuus]|nr:hypothetical protein HanPI659440_Chr14g0544641 [Helianthus annuus]
MGWANNKILNWQVKTEVAITNFRDIEAYPETTIPFKSATYVRAFFHRIALSSFHFEHSFAPMVKLPRWFLTSEGSTP